MLSINMPNSCPPRVNYKEYKRTRNWIQSQHWSPGTQDWCTFMCFHNFISSCINDLIQSEKIELINIQCKWRIVTYELCHFSQWSYHLAKCGGGRCAFWKKHFGQKNFWPKTIIWGVFVVLSLSSALPPLLLFPGLHSSPHWMPLSKVPKFAAQVAQKLFWGGCGSIVIWVKLNKEKSICHTAGTR